MVQEIHNISWVKKDRQGNNNLKGKTTTKWVPQTMNTRSIARKLLEDQSKNEKIESTSNKQAKKCKV
jgi:hypothetical protein